MTSLPKLRRGPIFTALMFALVAAISGCSSNSDGSVTPDPGATEPPAALALVDAPALRIVEPADGATVTSPVRLEVDVDNYALAAKGVSRDGEGHFHVIVDRPCVTPGDVINDDHHHVGSGDAFTEIELSPGTHELCLQVGDGFHTAVDISAAITITVVDDN